MLHADGHALATLAWLTDGLGPDVERHDHPAVVAIGSATAALVRGLELPIELVPWAPAVLAPAVPAQVVQAPAILGPDVRLRP
jgi:hypothetical protein